MERLHTPAALGAAVRARRQELGLSQDDLAVAIGVSRRVIGFLERGKETVQLDIAFAAARALGMDLGYEIRGSSRA